MTEQLASYLRDPVQLVLRELVLPTGKPYAATAQRFQRAFFEAVFATMRNGRPRHRLVYDERRRGESKTEDCAAVALADLLTGPHRHRSYAVAADLDQAALLLDSVAGFKSRSPILADLEVLRNVVVNPATGSELRVMSSDSPTSYGIRPRKVYFDELSLQPDERLWTSMWTAIGKRADAQMVAVSMAGWDFSSIGWRVRELARTGRAYHFATRHGTKPAPWLSRRAMEEQRATLHPADFARFWECRWTEPKGSWITADMYDAAQRGRPALAGDRRLRYGGFVDVGLVHDPTVVAVCHRETGGDGDVIVLDALETFQGSRESNVELEAVEDAVVALAARLGCRRWVFEAPQAVASVQRLKRRMAGASVEARYPTADSMANLFGTLYRLFSNRQLVVFAHERLRKECLSLVTKTVGGRLKVVESSGVHQDHVVALGGAADMLMSEPAHVGVPRDATLAPITSRGGWSSGSAAGRASRRPPRAVAAFMAPAMGSGQRERIDPETGAPLQPIMRTNRLTGEVSLDYGDGEGDVLEPGRPSPHVRRRRGGPDDLPGMAADLIGDGLRPRRRGLPAHLARVLPR